jgi:hypothetical protein
LRKGNALRLDQCCFNGAFQSRVADVAGDLVGLFGELQPGLGKRRPERPVVFIAIDIGVPQTDIRLRMTKFDCIH